MQDSRCNIRAKFTAAHRLLRKNAFDHVVKAENIADRQYKVFFVRNDKFNARLGIIVSKRTLSRAVDRNREKRLIREAFRQHSVKACKLDLCVLIRRSSGNKSITQADNLKLLFSRAEDRCAEL